MLYKFAVLWRKTSFWVWPCSDVEIRPCRFHPTWITFPLLLPVLRGDYYCWNFLLLLLGWSAWHNIWFFIWFTGTMFSCFQALFPFQDWWVVPAKVAFDQTLWAAVWNSIYYTVVGFLRFDSPANVFGELRATFWPMLTVRNRSALSIPVFSSVAI